MGEVLLYTREPGNCHDPHSIAYKKAISLLGILYIKYLSFAQSLYNKEEY